VKIKKIKIEGSSLIDVIKNVLTLDILVPYILYIYIREGQSFYL